jgi:hypothetical protein
MLTKFWLESVKGRDHSEDLGVDGKIILNESWEIGFRGVDCVHLAQDRCLWLALVNTVMNHRVP